MDELAKRWIWVANLGILAILAYLSARVGSNVLAAEIANIETRAGRGSDPAKSPTQQDAIPVGQRTADWAELISAVNLFNATPPQEPDEVDVEGALEDQEQVEQSSIPGPFADCKKVGGSLTLLATMVAEPSEWSVAVVRTDGKERLIKEDQPIGDADVVAIYRNRMVLRRNGAVECADLGSDTGGPRPPLPVDLSTSVPPRATGRRPDTEEIRSGVTKVSDSEYKIDRAMLDKQLGDFEALTQQARMVPNFQDGKPAGFKLTRVRHGSLYTEIGLERGDVIREINGESIDSPNKALEMYDKMQTSSSFNITIERRGRRMAVDYSIQ